MENVTKVQVGVDVSKDQLDIHIHPLGESIFFANSEEGIKYLIELLSTHVVDKVVCESTGGYEDLMLKVLRKSGYKMWQVEPNRIKSFIRSKGKKAKTDTIDAYMIALFAAQETQEHEHVDYGENHSLIRNLVKRKKDLIEMIVAEKLRLKHPSQTTCSVEIQAHIDFMNKQVKELEKKIQELINKDDDLSAKATLITSFPGIGLATAAMLIAEMPELGKIDNKKAAALVGVVPYTQQSGKFRGKAFISGGRAVIRSAIYMAALVASRFNPAMKEFYQRLRETSKKSPKVALVAVMRKLIVILNVMIRTKTMWRDVTKNVEQDAVANVLAVGQT